MFSNRTRIILYGGVALASAISAGIAGFNAEWKALAWHGTIAGTLTFFLFRAIRIDDTPTAPPTEVVWKPSHSWILGSILAAFVVFGVAALWRGIQEDSAVLMLSGLVMAGVGGLFLFGVLLDGYRRLRGRGSPRA